MALHEEELTTCVLSIRSSCTAAALVGSVVENRDIEPADVDVTALDPETPVGKDHVLTGTVHSSPLHVAVYHPTHFFAALESPQLALLYMREIRKLLRGTLLFDYDGELQVLRNIARSYRLPKVTLQPVVDRALATAPLFNSPFLSRLSVYHSAESLCFLWFHSDILYRYSKPKWLLDDVRNLPAPKLYQLLQSLSQEMVQSGTIPYLVREAAKITGHSTARESRAHLHANDALYLVERGRLAEAVWPLRMFVYQLYAHLADNAHLKYVDIRSIADLDSALAASIPHISSLMSGVLLKTLPLQEKLFDELRLAQVEARSMWAAYLENVV